MFAAALLHLPVSSEVMAFPSLSFVVSPRMEVAAAVSAFVGIDGEGRFHLHEYAVVLRHH